MKARFLRRHLDHGLNIIEHGFDAPVGSGDENASILLRSPPGNSIVIP